ncbi:helix-turn-helix domain-containing protein [Streptomyces sp. NPDC050534]|uniref:helix-turn-helix domain-containing protein n=1 Tax=Streptomyces sp. NPDC050534 TaxID=3365625 RepID=UPI0037916CF5
MSTIKGKVHDGAAPRVSARTLQRRFVAATGLTRGAIRQIHRAREAAVLIQEGLSAQEVVHRLGYFDQPHMARSLTRYIGRTATGLCSSYEAEPPVASVQDLGLDARLAFLG